MHLKDILEKKWLLYQYSDTKVFDIYDKWWQTLYFGVDPSADSMHIGHFTTFMTALNYMQKWNKLVMIVGWATWMIGDPSWKDSDRDFLDEETIQKNAKSLEQQMKKIISNLEEITWQKYEWEVINNKDFYKNMSFLEFLRNVWKYITVNNMMSKETVKPRIEDPNKSISYTEFSYMLIQAYDFLRLYEDKSCLLQICGSDQWWNWVTWVELIRKVKDVETYVVSSPLVLDSSWKKFGKSEWNAIWLDENKTSPYFVYQYFMNCTDEEVERFLKIYTILEFDKIDNIIDKHRQQPESRYWQQQLAYNVVRTVFWEKQAVQAEKISKLLFGKEDKLKILEQMDKNDLDALYYEIGWVELEEESQKLIDLITNSGLTSSNAESKKLIKSKAIYLNEENIQDLETVVSKDQLINGKVWLIRKWKKNYKLILA